MSTREDREWDAYLDRRWVCRTCGKDDANCRCDEACERCGYAAPDHSRDCANAARPEYPAIGDVSVGRGELAGGDVQALPVYLRSKRPRKITRHDQLTPLPGDSGWDEYRRNR